MDTKSFIASAIGSVAWPLVVLTILFFARRQIPALARRVLEVSLPGGTKLIFANELEKAREASDELTLPKSNEPEAISDPDLELAHKFPEASVLKSFKTIEAAFVDYRQSHGGMIQPRSLAAFVKILHGWGVINGNLVELFEIVRRTRNAAVHAGENVVTPGEALEYRELCKKVADGISLGIAILDHTQRPTYDPQQSFP